MDKYLVEYLRSGKAWVLVGSGPSLQMGYPSWAELAKNAARWVKGEVTVSSTSPLDNALQRAEWPTVFSEISTLLGGEDRLLQYLQTELKPRDGHSEIYELMARWPVPVYLTTNWDDEIQKHLTKVGETYLTYENTPDHMAHLIPDIKGAIFKLHGDLRSSAGLVMTQEEYEDIDKGTPWNHWRSKMNAVFQMARIVVVGHSLTDPHVRSVLAAAKIGAGIVQPVVWLAPDANDDQRREFLEKHRIRVVPYDNRDGNHANLLRLLQDVSQFVPPREGITIQTELAAAIPSGLKSDSAAASALMVYSKLSESDPIETMRNRLIVTAIESAIPELATRESFTLEDALLLAGWPEDCPLGDTSAAAVVAEAEKQGLLKPINGRLLVTSPAAEQIVHGHMESHKHVRERFHRAVAQRINRLFSALSQESDEMATAIDNALIGCFRADGFAMAASALGKRMSSRRNLPTKLLGFLNEASAQYPDLLRRQAFTSTIIDILVNPTSADTEYLGALIGGYCAFNYLGVFGDVAIERMQHARDTVWLIDSNLQIPALALGSPTGMAFTACIQRLYTAGVPLFTLESLFEETFVHFDFANRVLKIHGPTSPEILYAAQGQPPYRKSNQFLQGYIRWQASGNPPDWDLYLHAVFGTMSPDRDVIRSRVEALGITVVNFQDWPGFDQNMFVERDQQRIKITEMRSPEALEKEEEIDEYGETLEASRKAKPEAEAMLVIQGERKGFLHILSDKAGPSQAWFISHTSILNAVCESNLRITWWPESFLRFTESLTQGSIDALRTERIFQTLLWTFAQSGVSPIDRNTVEAVFGSIGEQCEVEIKEQRERYASVLSAKYGATPEQVLRSVPLEDRPLAALQMANEVAQIEMERAHVLAQSNQDLAKKAKVMEAELDKLDKYKKKFLKREEIRKRNKRKAQSERKKRGR